MFCGLISFTPINVQVCHKLGRGWYQTDFSFFFLSEYGSNFPSCIILLEIYGFKKCPKVLGHPVVVFTREFGAKITLKIRPYSSTLSIVSSERFYRTSEIKI